MLVYMEHPHHGTHIAYDHGEVERCKANGWKVREEPEQKQDDERDELIAMLEELGIPHDKRWGIKKLREALE